MATPSPHGFPILSLIPERLWQMQHLRAPSVVLPALYRCAENALQKLFQPVWVSTCQSFCLRVFGVHLRRSRGSKRTAQCSPSRWRNSIGKGCFCQFVYPVSRRFRAYWHVRSRFYADEPLAHHRIIFLCVNECDLIGIALDNSTRPLSNRI